MDSDWRTSAQRAPQGDTQPMAVTRVPPHDPCVPVPDLSSVEHSPGLPGTPTPGRPSPRCRGPAG